MNVANTFQYFTYWLPNINLKKIRYVKFHEIGLKTNELAFQKFFGLKKIIKVDEARSINRREFGVKMPIFLIVNQLKLQDGLSREIT